MKSCENCGKKFDVWNRIDGKLHNLNSRRYCLECSPFGKHNTQPISKEPKVSKVCTMCGRDKPLGEYYKKGRWLHSACRECTNKESTEQQRRRKAEAVAYKGGRCLRCGYAGSVAVFDFHHVEPDKKLFEIARMKKRSFGFIKAELDKCVLLCANCHRELAALGGEADWGFLR